MVISVRFSFAFPPSSRPKFYSTQGARVSSEKLEDKVQNRRHVFGKVLLLALCRYQLVGSDSGMQFPGLFSRQMSGLQTGAIYPQLDLDASGICLG